MNLFPHVFMVSDFFGVCLLLLTPYPCSESLVTGCCAHLILWGFLLTVIDFGKEASNFLRVPVPSLTPSVLPEQGVFSLWYSRLPALGSVGYDPWHCSKGSVCTCQLSRHGPLCAEAGRETWLSSALSAFAVSVWALMEVAQVISSCRGKGISPLLLVSVEQKGHFGVTC